jgi:hypothetical protein
MGMTYCAPSPSSPTVPLDPAREDEKELPLAGLEPRGAREFTDTVAKPLDGGALSLVGTRTPARGRTAAACFLPPAAMMGAAAVGKKERRGGRMKCPRV